MKLTVERYPREQVLKWNKFVDQATNGVLFHRLDFLNYHGDRFSNQEHHLAWYHGEALYAVMPMAIFSENGRNMARSPFGGSYGGIVLKEAPTYQAARELVSTLVGYLRTHDIAELTLTPPIQVCHQQYSETFAFALLEQGFKIVNSDISSVVMLKETEDIEKNLFSSRARNMARKASKSGITVKFRQPVVHFWPMLEKTYTKLGKQPTHSLKEWQWLCDHLPGETWCDVAYLDDQPVAGIGHFQINTRVDSSFYLASDPEFQHYQGLSLLVYEALLEAKKQQYQYFDFGTSTSNMIARENIFQFKESFGAIGMFRNTYKLIL